MTFDKAVEHARRQTGKLVNLMLSVYQGDYAEVVDQLKREGLPKRIEPYSYHVRQTPGMLAGEGSHIHRVGGKLWTTHHEHVA